MGFCDFPSALPFLVIGSAGEPQTPRSAALLRTAAWSCTWNEYYTNERQSRDSNRSAANAGPMRTKSCVLGGRYELQRTLAIRIAAITLASDSGITIARFRPLNATATTMNIGQGPQNGLSCDPNRHLQESPASPGPKSQESLKKRLFGGRVCKKRP